MRGELGLAPEMHAARPGPLPALSRARPNQFTLELGETTQDGQHQGGHGVMSEQAHDQDAYEPDLDKAEASKRIDQLKQQTGR